MEWSLSEEDSDNVQYERALEPSKFSYFLFGPRGTGKSTWIQATYPNAMTVNLLRAKEYRELLKDPGLLEQWVKAANPKTVVIDEIQKLPELLDEIQNLMFERKSLQFVLTGSSARKLKKMNANLLAGRARTREFYTITSHEMNYNFNLRDILRFGCLPAVLNLNSAADKAEFLEAYVQTYLNEEIKQEAIVRALEPFVRFLEVSSLMNGQIWNGAAISRDVGSVRTTIEGYLSVILDTLIAVRIDAFKARAKVKERHNPKYYYFDPGVVRALGGRLHAEIESQETGYLFETFILNEIRAYASYRQKRIKIFHWGTPSRNEVDFVIESGKAKIALELKTSKQWKSEFNFGLKSLLEEEKVQKAYGIYDGDRALTADKIAVLPVKTFLRQLWAGEIV